jgi:putative ABC transport system permease protein
VEVEDVMSQLSQHLRFAVRSLRQQPGLALAALLTLALGIGVNSAIFSIVDTVLLTPPPFRDPARLVIVWGSDPPLAKKLGIEDKIPVTNANLSDLEQGSRSFERLALASANRLALTGQGDPEQLGAVYVLGDLFNTLGARAAMGRTLVAADDVPGTPSVVVLSHGLWQRKFGGDPRIVGREVSLGNHPATVVGVMPARFTFPRGGVDAPSHFGLSPDPDVWVPAGGTLETRQNRGTRYNVMVARLRPGVTLAQAQAELDTISQRLVQSFPNTDKGFVLRLQPLLDQMLGSLRPALFVLWGAVGFVLLIACANVANLLLARAASRQKEIAVRMAIGAGRRQLVAQLLAESVVLSVAGGILGLALAWAGLHVFAGLVPPGLVDAGSFALDGRALAFTAGLCLLTSVLAGLVPALQMTRPDLAGTLREGTRAGAGTAGSHRTRNALVVAEVAFAVLLLIGAGLLLRSFDQLLRVDPGFRPQHVLAFELGLSKAIYPAEKRFPFYDRVVEGVRGLPGVAAVAMISELPMGGTEQVTSILLEGRPKPKPGETPLAPLRRVSPGYFELMRIPLHRGRLPGPGDRQGTMPVLVIDEAMARTYWPGEDAVGKRLRTGGDDTWYTVIGVVGDVHDTTLQEVPRPEVFQLASQVPQSSVSFMNRIVVRTQGEPQSLVQGVQEVVHHLDPNQPVSRIRTMEQVVDLTVARPRFSMLLLSLFAGLALVLAIVGIYGITSYSVSQRRRELGLRMALGAQPQGILGLVMRETGTLAVAGVLLGLAAALALTRAMTSLLFGVGAADPATFLGVPLGLVLVSLVAAWFPGRRATRVDPVVALRAE